MTPWKSSGASAPMSVIGVVTISLPGSGSTAATAQCIAAVPEVHANAWATPSRSAKSRSKALTNEPLVGVSVPLRIASLTSSISRVPSDRPLAFWSEGNTTRSAKATPNLSFDPTIFVILHLA
jgi:hypothetical protein